MISTRNLLGQAHLTRLRVCEARMRSNKKRHTVKVGVVSGDAWRLFQPWRAEKNPRPPPRPLLAQGVNSPEVSGELGAEKPTGLSSLIRAAG